MQCLIFYAQHFVLLFLAVWSWVTWFFSCWERKNCLQGWPKNTKNGYFVCFWAYIRQPHGHIGWATSMPFVSINSTQGEQYWKLLLLPSTLLTQGPIHEIFMTKYWELAVLKISGFLSKPFWNFIFKKLLHSHENKSKFIG